MRSLKEMMDLSGKLALVTGGTGWLGSAMSESLLELGAEVVSVSRGVSDKFTLSNHVDHDLFHEEILDLDVVDEQLTLKTNVLLDKISNEHGKYPSILVNNMCVWPKQLQFLSADASEMRNALTSNVVPQLYMAQCVAKHMTLGGSIINIASMYGKVSPDLKMYKNNTGNALEYGAAKAALIQATKYLACLLGPQKIRVNSISPGPFSRAGAFTDKEWLHEELINRTMLCRIGHREEIKGTIALLASDLGSYITGEDISVDGGWTKL